MTRLSAWLPPTPANFSVHHRWLSLHGSITPSAGLAPSALRIRVRLGKRLVDCDLTEEFGNVPGELRFRTSFRTSEGPKWIVVEASEDSQTWKPIARRLLYIRERVPSSGRIRLGPSNHSARHILLVSGEPSFIGHRYRVENLAAALVDSGCAVTVVPQNTVHGSMLEKNTVAVLFWRARLDGSSVALINAARSRGIRIGFDCDDLIFDPDLANPSIIDGIRSGNLSPASVAQHFTEVAALLHACDFVLAPTKAILRAAARFGKPGHLLLNGFDKRFFEISTAASQTPRPDDGFLRVGYAGGSKTHQRDFAVVVPHLARLFDRHSNLRLVLFRKLLDITEFPELAPYTDRVEWRDPVPHDKLPAEVARFDINLAPLELGNPFCEAKSELKFFEAALVGVPTVATPTEPFAAAIENGRNGLLAGKEDWEQAINSLLVDPALRSSLARAALQDVIWRHGPERRTLIVRHIFNHEVGDVPSRAASAMILSQLQREGRSPAPVIPACETLFAQPPSCVAQVTVVIPLYNYARFVVEALESLRTQTLKHFDLVIVDDCSTDDSLKVALNWLAKHAIRFNQATLLRTRINSRLGPARNAGFAHARTRHVFALDADNLILPNCLERCLAEIESTGADAVYPLIRQFGDGSSLMGGHPWDFSRLACGNYIDAMALVRKAAWVAVGGYSNRHGWEDYDLWLKFIEHGLRATPLSEECALYRVHGSSMLATETNREDIRPRLLAMMRENHPWLNL